MSGRKLFHKLSSINDVIGKLSKHLELKPKGIEYVNLDEALNRVLAEDIHSPLDYPPFDRSEVDGYAVRAEDTYGADEEHPIRLKLIGSVEVGQVPKYEVTKGTAVEVATGALIPKGANAVIMEEYTHKVGNEVLVYRYVAPGENIALTSSDISMGDLILRKGTKLEPHHIALLAGLGMRKVKVYRKVRVAIFSTGNEVIKPGEPLKLGLIYDSNSYYLISALRKLGAEAEFVAHLPDNYDLMLKELSKALDKYDVIITSGGTSAGIGDLIYRVFDSLGNPGVVIHGLKIKPGKPTVFAVVNGKLLIGMPGFPLSCTMVFHKVVRPIIARLLGIEVIDEVSVKAILPYRLRVGKGRSWLIPVSLVSDGKKLIAYPVTFSSGSIAALTYADGYIYVSEDKELLMEGEEVDVYLFKDSIKIPELTIIGSHDIALWRILVRSGLITKSKVLHTGSLRGWYAVKNGEADIAPTHLLDEETGEYNIPFLSKMGLKGVAVIIRGYKRRIGFVVAKGNPKGIYTFKDLLRSDVIFVNRVKGSGIRVFIDLQLKKLSEQLGLKFSDLTSKINGYNYEVKTHTAVAAAIAQGRADVGIAAEIAARMYNLEFIPLTTEIVDFLIRKDRFAKESVVEFVNIMRSDIVRELLREIPGYEILSDTGKIFE